MDRPSKQGKKTAGVQDAIENTRDRYRVTEQVLDDEQLTRERRDELISKNARREDSLTGFQQVIDQDEP